MGGDYTACFSSLAYFRVSAQVLAQGSPLEIENSEEIIRSIQAAG
jgi:hypothetical protein